jgi:hypothetical protein
MGLPSHYSRWPWARQDVAQTLRLRRHSPLAPRKCCRSVSRRIPQHSHPHCPTHRRGLTHAADSIDMYIVMLIKARLCVALKLLVRTAERCLTPAVIPAALVKPYQLSVHADPCMDLSVLRLPSYFAIGLAIPVVSCLLLRSGQSVTHLLSGRAQKLPDLLRFPSRVSCWVVMVYLPRPVKQANGCVHAGRPPSILRIFLGKGAG